MLVNGKELKTYKLDTILSIINRIAVSLKTLPKYLYFKNGIPSINDINIEVEDLKETIKTITITDFRDLNIQDKLQQQNISFEDDIIPLFIVYNKNIENEIRQYPNQFKNTYLENLDISKNIIDIWERKTTIKTDLDKQIKKFIEDTDQQTKIIIEYDNIINIANIQENINFSTFQPETIKFNIIFKPIDNNIMEIFNRIKLNDKISFAKFNNFYKILKNFIPRVDWSTPVDFGIVLFKNSKNYNKDDDQILCTIDTENNNKIIANMTRDVTDTNNELFNNFLKVIDYTQDAVESVDELEVKGVFFIPNQKMNNYVFADLAMNNPLFSSLISINEHEKATKNKNNIYIYSNSDITGYITATLTQKTIEENDKLLKNFPNIFPVKSNYINIKINAKNIEAIKEFQKIITNLFYLYNQNYTEIVNFYKEYLKDSIEDSYIADIEDIKTKKHRLISGHTRKCTHVPAVISDKEAEKERQKGNIVIEFPKTPEEGKQYNYTCTNHTKSGHIYPYLLVSNSEIFPYLPCCSTRNQTEKEGSIFRHYYYGEDLIIKEGKQQNLIKTNKFVMPNKFGILPLNIDKMFQIIDTEKDYIFVRKGVVDTKNSFITCVAEALKQNVEDTDRLRLELATPEYAALCKQELFDHSISEIIDKIKDNTIYFSPHDFISLIETYFNCNIFIFTRNTINGEMSLPRYTKGYYKYERKEQCIFIFEHIGSESDNAKYPRCELICRWKETESTNIQYIFSYDSGISINVRNIFDQLRKTYTLNKPIKYTTFNININLNLKFNGQYIDTYGKTRLLQLVYNQKLVTLLTTPIPPLKTIELDTFAITKIDIKLALNLASRLKMIVSGQTVVNNNLKNIFGKIGNVKVIIPVIDHESINGIPIYKTDNVSYIDNTSNSALVTYNEYKKLARYITQYMLWLYSRFLFDKNETEMSLENISEFVNQYIIINSGFQYGTVDKIFSINSGLMANNRLVINSEEMLKRLIYVLRISFLRNKLKILAYHNTNTIDNYYTDLNDFDTYNFQVILEGIDSLSKWINERQTNFFLHSTIVFDYTDPYFFENSLIDNNIYLAQNFNNIEMALNKAKAWVKSDISSPRFTLYSYTNSNRIVKHNITGVQNNHNFKIIASKNSNKLVFTVLLSL
jgi:hypothetical protein